VSGGYGSQTLERERRGSKHEAQRKGTPGDAREKKEGRDLHMSTYREGTGKKQETGEEISKKAKEIAYTKFKVQHIGKN